MRTIDSLTLDELRYLVEGMRDVMYRTADGELDPDKDLGADDIEAMCELMRLSELAPEER